MINFLNSMKHLLKVLMLTTLFLFPADRPGHADTAGVPRISVLPFHNDQKDPSLDPLKELIPEMMSITFTQGRQTVVDRALLDQIVKEQRLGLGWEMGDSERLKIGKLLSATVMISGSFRQEDGALIVEAQATDVPSGRLLTSAQTKGPADDLSNIVQELCRKLSKELSKDLPPVTPKAADQSPLTNLHFMQGLSHFYSADYHQAVADFIEASKDEKLRDMAKFWLAKTYLENESYSHAFIELNTIRQVDGTLISKDEIDKKKAVCRKHLTQEEVQMYENIF